MNLTELASTLQQARDLQSQGRPEAAVPLLERILRSHPRALEALIRLATIYGQSQQPKKALILLDKAIKLDARNPSLYNNRGLVQQALGQWPAAMASFERAIALKPDHAIAWFNRGNICQHLGRSDDAIASFERAIALDPHFADAHYNRGVILANLELWDAALASYDRAVAARPNHAEAHFNRGNIHRELTQWEAALESFARAIAARPGYVEAHFNRGEVMHALGRMEEAEASYGRALALRPDYAKAYQNRGNVLRDLRRFDAALSDYRRALEIDPALEFLYGTMCGVRMQLCDWDGVEADMRRLTDMLDRGAAAAPPFGLLALLGSPVAQRQAAEIWVRKKFPPNPAFPPIRPYAGHDQIRVAYLSADFHEHATAYLIAQLLELHDRSRFRIVALSFGPDSQGPMRRRLVQACDEFLEVRETSDGDVVSMMRGREIDIAVDLKGFTQGARTGIFARRAAPLQVNYLGYPGTMGAPYIDYLITDPVLVPVAMRPHYTEKLIYLPHTYQANDATRQIAARPLSRDEAGLPPNGFVFCCFNNSFKILPESFEVWMRILERLPGSVLWLYEDNPTAAENLRREAARRRVAAERLIFASRLPLPDHLARHRLADLFLDTWPYNAHTTASDALWAGLPVLTLSGESFASRVAASLLHGIGLSDLVTVSPGQYETLAVLLATDGALLAEIRQRLAGNRRTTPLFDTPSTARHIEAAYRGMYERQRGGLPPDDLYLSP